MSFKSRFKFLPLVAACLFALTIACESNAQTPTEPDSESEQDMNDSDESPTSSDSVKVPSLIRFAAIVQFVSGEAYRVESKTNRSRLEHKAVIYEGERINVAKGATLKIVTRNRCTAVIHGEGVFLAPNREKMWRMKADAIRWICPDKADESFVFGRNRITVDGGEVLVEPTNLLALKNKVSSRIFQGDFELRTLYTLSGRRYVKAEKQPSPLDLWQMNSNRKPPKESAEWTKPKEPEAPKAPRVVSSRWIIGPAGGGSSVHYDNEALNQEGLEGADARFQVQWKVKDKDESWILAVSIRERRSKDRESSPGNPPAAGANTQLDAFHVEFGRRYLHSRWWSPFVRFGGGTDTARIQVYRPDINYQSRHEYEFYTFTAAAGVDAFLPPDWTGGVALYAGAEIFGAQSLGRKERVVLDPEFSSGTTPSEANQPWRLTSLGLNLMLGLALQF